MNSPTAIENLLVLSGALAFDLLWGEPPARLHPVVWFGYLIEVWKRLAPRRGRAFQLFYGLTAVLLSTGLVLAGTWYALGWLRDSAPLVAILLEAYLLKGCLSIRMLADEGLKIRQLLKQDKLEDARYAMRSLVSRDTSRLDSQEICGAAIESVTENATDSLVAPLCFFALLGVPGVLAYRLAQTFDSMIGYRGRYEYLGKSAARLDDILNFLPARLTALLFIVSAGWYRGNRSNAWKIARRDHGLTASPNAGWTMAAMAGALQVRLVKVGHYSLGDPTAALHPGLINRAVAALYIVSAEMVTLLVLLIVVRSFAGN